MCLRHFVLSCVASIIFSYQCDSLEPTLLYPEHLILDASFDDDLDGFVSGSNDRYGCAIVILEATSSKGQNARDNSPKQTSTHFACVFDVDLFLSISLSLSLSKNILP